MSKHALIQLKPLAIFPIVSQRRREVGHALDISFCFVSFKEIDPTEKLLHAFVGSKFSYDAVRPEKVRHLLEECPHLGSRMRWISRHCIAKDLCTDNFVFREVLSSVLPWCTKRRKMNYRNTWVSACDHYRLCILLISSFQFIKESTPSDHTAQDREPVFTQILHIFILAHDSGAKGPPLLVMVQTQQPWP